MIFNCLEIILNCLKETHKINFNSAFIPNIYKVLPFWPMFIVKLPSFLCFSYIFLQNPLCVLSLWHFLVQLSLISHAQEPHILVAAMLASADIRHLSACVSVFPVALLSLWTWFPALGCFLFCYFLEYWCCFSPHFTYAFQHSDTVF